MKERTGLKRLSVLVFFRFRLFRPSSGRSLTKNCIETLMTRNHKLCFLPDDNLDLRDSSHIVYQL